MLNIRKYRLPTLLCGLTASFSAMACRDTSDRNMPPAKSVSETKNTVDKAKENVREQQDDVRTAQQGLAEQQDELARAKTDFAAKQQRFVEATQTRLRELDARIANLEAELKSSAGAMTADKKKSASDNMAKLRQKRDVVATSLSNAKTGVAEQWNAIETRTSETLKELENAIDDAARTIRK